MPSPFVPYCHLSCLSYPHLSCIMFTSCMSYFQPSCIIFTSCATSVRDRDDFRLFGMPYSHLIMPHFHLLYTKVNDICDLDFDLERAKPSAFVLQFHLFCVPYRGHTCLSVSHHTVHPSYIIFTFSVLYIHVSCHILTFSMQYHHHSCRSFHHLYATPSPFVP